MKLHLLDAVVLAFGPLLLRTLLYLLAYRTRSIRITSLSAIILAGPGTVLAIVPIPIPPMLRPALIIGIVMFLMSRYAEADLCPDIIFLPLVVELLSMVTVSELLQPMMT